MLFDNSSCSAAGADADFFSSAFTSSSTGCSNTFSSCFSFGALTSFSFFSTAFTCSGSSAGCSGLSDSSSIGASFSSGLFSSASLFNPLLRAYFCILYNCSTSFTIVSFSLTLLPFSSSSSLSSKSLISSSSPAKVV